MGKQFNIGVSGVARRVKQPYIGVSGVARKVKAGYIGVNGVARQFYSAVDWFVPTGYNEANILAAYQFKYAESESDALKNLVNSGTFPLVKDTNITWAAATGFTFPVTGGIHNAALFNSNIAFIALHFIRASGDRYRYISYCGNDKSLGFATLTSDGDYSKELGITNGSGVSRVGSKTTTDAYIGGDFVNRTIFYQTWQAATTFNSGNIIGAAEGKLLGGRYSGWYPNETPDMILTCAAFYSVALTLAQYQSVQAKMAAVGI